MKRLIAALFFIPTVVLAFPQPQGYVSDFAGVLKQRAVIEHRISDFHKNTSNEIAVVTITSLGGESIEEYAQQLFRAWGIGQKGKNNGLLILVAVNDHKTRIEVGYGLEGRLNDGACGRIIRDDMLPSFRVGDFDAGINYALTDLFKKIGE